MEEAHKELQHMLLSTQRSEVMLVETVQRLKAPLFVVRMLVKTPLLEVRSLYRRRQKG